MSGDDVLDEDVTEEITQPTAVALSLSQPSTPESQDPPQRPFKPRSLSTTSHKVSEGAIIPPGNESVLC